MGDSLEGSEGAPETQNVAVVDSTAFINYILKAAAILLPEDDSQAQPIALKAALDDKANQEFIRKFISDPQISTLYIQRSSSKGKWWLLKGSPHSAYGIHNINLGTNIFKRNMNFSAVYLFCYYLVYRFNK